MRLGRFKLWFASKKIYSEFGGWRRQFSIFNIINNKKDIPTQDRIICYFMGKKILKKTMKRDKWQDFSSGVITHHIWRFCLSVQTPKYHIQQKGIY